MKHGDDFEALAAQSVWDDVPSAWNYELASPGHPAGTAEIRHFCQAIDGSK
jgi:hypothetical protein